MRRITDLIRYHRRRGTIAAVAVLAALGGGIAAGALTAGTGAALASPTASTAPATPATSLARAHSGTRRAARGVRGTVIAIGATVWTVKTAAGVSVTVRITPSTHFGPRVAPSRVAVGDAVVVIGARQGTTVAASRIRMARLPVTPARPAPHR